MTQKPANQHPVTPPNEVLRVSGLHIATGRAGQIGIVDDVSFTVAAGRCLALVGESGSGKSLTLKSVIDLLPTGVAMTGGSIEVNTARSMAATAADGDVGMIFQEPMTALNPSMRIGRFLEKCVRMHRSVSKAEAQAIAIELLVDLGVPDPEQKMRAWPHELSGGLRQRIVIAAALASEPSILLCDEPTTALDVTVQDQILGLLDHIRTERDVAIVFVTHDLAVVARLAQDVAVMYAGQIVETGPVAEVFSDPQHPYTKGLLAAMPHVGSDSDSLATIPGSLPPVGNPPPGCRFAPRCPYADAKCTSIDGSLRPVSEARTSACIEPSRMLQHPTAGTTSKMEPTT